MAMANAYGLFMVICFLGHGLVQLPKTTWFRGNRKVVLRFVFLFFFFLKKKKLLESIMKFFNFFLKKKTT